VALAALRRVARRADGRATLPMGGDPLADRLCRELGVAHPSELVSAIYAPGMDRARIAALAPSVVAAAADDPTIVADLLEPAGRELGEAVAAVARALGWPGGSIPLALAGGFLLAAHEVAASLHAYLGGAGYSVNATPVE
jgi:N-acetylglucosamine kinase-like BadF-type ATPase